ncbi:MAG: hypothetical protein ACXWEY_09440 [Bacteroidia bacterium]
MMFLCLPSLSVANHILGASMEYENIGKDSFLVRVQVYRNCSDKQLTATPISFRSNCGGASVSAGGEIKTSTDITPFCATACNTCTDKNCSYGFGLQSVTIETIVDFSKYNCCQFTISWEQCCLPYSITTGAAGQNFYTEVFLDKCISANHNSPKFIYDPVSIVALNQCISRSQAAKGDEGDSLVYKLVEPLSAAGTAIPYNENYSREAPLKYAGYPDRDKDFENKNCYGFHFDEQTGELNFKPTQEDVSVIAIEVQQWHKDSTGTYRKIGTTRRQNTITVKEFSGNRSPILADYLSDKKTIRICAGSMLDFKIYSFDSNGDSLKINWTTNISNANISATSSKYPVIDFSWQTSAADARTAPYFLTINANDGACPLPAETQITYKIYVESGIQPKFSLVKKQLDCNTYSFRAMDSSKQQLSYKWYVNEKLVSTDSAFTKAFLQAGKYAIRLNATGSCTSYYLDSVEIKSIPAVTNGSVKQVCLGDTITLQAQQSNKYKWFSSENIIGSDTVSTISVSPTKSAIYYVNITDTQFKCVKKDSVRVIVNNDCVWPGDANRDGIVNHLDVLEIGVGFGANGLARTDTSTNWKVI